MLPFDQFLEAWNQPAMRHAMVGHFPIVLSVIGLPFVILAAMWGRRVKSLRWIAVATYLLLVISAYVTRNAGDAAHDAIAGSLSDEAHELLEEHEDLGDNVWLLALIPTVFLGLSFVPKPKVRHPAAWLAVIGALVTAARIAETADHGGRLVYEHAAGTPDQWALMFPAGESEAQPTDDARLTFFRNQVRPILAEYCWGCHNPKRYKRAGGLDQTSIAALLRGGMSGQPAVVPGRPSDSLMIQKLRHDDEEERMPPGDDPLPEDLIGTLERWIAEGAVWEPPDEASPASPEPDERP